MPSVITHAAVGLGCARIFFPSVSEPAFWLTSAALAMLPDIDVLAFRFGIPYEARFGHRGFTHSLFCAMLVGTATAFPMAAWLSLPIWLVALYFSGVMASHGILDLFTNGGMGIAVLAPIDDTRYFSPWRPIQVCLIGAQLLHPWNLRAFRSELLWVWLPLALILSLTEVLRT